MSTDVRDLLHPFIVEQAIDLTAFIGTWPWRLPAGVDASGLAAAADRLGLAALCVSHLASVFGFDTRSGNEALWQATAEDDRLLPFPILNPAAPGTDRELAWALTNGARGVRLTPGYHDYRLGDPAFHDLVRAVDEAGIPLQVCARLDDERLRHPRFRADDLPVDQLAELIRAHPGQRLILSGLRAAEWDAVRAHLNTGDDISGVVVDLWFVNGPAQIVRQLCGEQQAGHYAYGSGTPVQTAEATALQLAVADISAHDRQLLCRGNAERVLGTPP